MTERLTFNHYYWKDVSESQKVMWLITDKPLGRGFRKTHPCLCWLPWYFILSLWPIKGQKERGSREKLPKIGHDRKAQKGGNENVCISSWDACSPLSRKSRGGPEFGQNTFRLPHSLTLEFLYIELHREENLKVSGNYSYALGRVGWVKTP